MWNSEKSIPVSKRDALKHRENVIEQQRQASREDILESKKDNRNSSISLYDGGDHTENIKQKLIRYEKKKMVH